MVLGFEPTLGIVAEGVLTVRSGFRLGSLNPSCYSYVIAQKPKLSEVDQRENTGR